MDLKYFVDYLKRERKVSPNTADAYERDLIYFEKFLATRGIAKAEDAAGADVTAFLMELKDDGFSHGA